MSLPIGAKSLLVLSRTRSPDDAEDRPAAKRKQQRERERSDGIRKAGKHRNGCVSNLPRLHGVRGRRALGTQMGAQRGRQSAYHSESPGAWDQLLRYGQRLFAWEK